MTRPDPPHLVTDEDWVQRASCRNDDAEAWFRESQVAYAVYVCLGCPVIRECLEAALAYETTETRDGVWGGKTPEQRRRIAHSRRRQELRVAAKEAS